MNVGEISIRYKTVVLLGTALMAAWGIRSYFVLGKLEDPEFAIKTALVATPYPGASAEEVEQEVTDKIEAAVQQLKQLDEVRSTSRAGLSEVYVDIDDSYTGADLPQVWDELRRKINDVKRELPPGAGPPIVYDDFGDVYGILLAVMADGFLHEELREYVDDLKRELELVEGVARVITWGERQEVVYVELSPARLAELRIPPEAAFATLRQQNMVVDAGAVELGAQRLRLAPAGTFGSLDDIRNLVIRGAPSERVVRMGDLATISRGLLEPPRQVMRFDGKPAIALGISAVPGSNVIDVGAAVRKRLRELVAELPVGIETGVVAYQSQTVREAVRGFMLNLVEAVAIVLGLLIVFMGLRSGVLIGAGLLLTILATFIAMHLARIDLHRVSLGALIIALGMLVDNSIVVAEGILVRMQLGDDRARAASGAVGETGRPLLGATLVAILAFSPIFFSRGAVSEYTGSLFKVVAMSLFLSWVLSMTFTPVACYLWLRSESRVAGGGPYTSPIFKAYRRLLGGALRRRGRVVVAMSMLLGGSLVGWRFVEKSFFPRSPRPQMRVDYWLPEGSRIEETSADMARIESYLLDDPRVKDVAAFVGAGPPRFYLPLEPQQPNPAYGQIVVNIRDTDDLAPLVAETRAYLAEHFPQAEPRVRGFPLGPGVEFGVEARFRGPDPSELLRLSRAAERVMAAEPTAQDVRNSWRQRVKTVVPLYSQPRARRAAVSRDGLAASLKQAFDGLPVGLYREEDDLLPIILRPPPEERPRPGNLPAVPVWSEAGGVTVPLGQVVEGTRLRWEYPIITRFNRRRSIRAQCDPRVGTADELLARLRARVEALPLPPGYTLEWAGEHDVSSEAEGRVFAAVPTSLLLMVFVVILLFNAVRQPLIIFLTVPLAMIGVTVGLLVTREAFGFMALLGALSLSGMLIKNAVVLINRIDLAIAEGKDRHTAVVDSAVSRLRPVMMASMTTVVGMAPLLLDRLFASMAVTIMFGLTFATGLTLVFVPVLYELFFRR